MVYLNKDTTIFLYSTVGTDSAEMLTFHFNQSLVFVKKCGPSKNTILLLM
jgi:hypothetical protein